MEYIKHRLLQVFLPFYDSKLFKASLDTYRCTLALRAQVESQGRTYGKSGTDGGLSLCTSYFFCLSSMCLALLQPWSLVEVSHL